MRLIRLLKYDLAREADEWVEEGIIAPEQAAAICARYGVDYRDRSRQPYGYRVLMGLGYLFIGLAVLTLIGANWDEIPRFVRMAGLVALTLSANLIGLYKFRKDQAPSAVGWFFLGGLFYGTSIMLIAQIYHIGEHFPDGIFWWGIGVLPIGLMLESTPILLLASALGFIWFFVESSLNFYPALFPLFLAAIAWHMARGGPNYVMFLALISGIGIFAEYTLSWFLNDAAGFDAGVENILFGAGLFLAFHGLSKWLASRKDYGLADYGTLLDVWVLRFAIITLFVLSFSEPWRELFAAEWHMPVLASGLSVILSGAALWFTWRAGASLISTAAFVILFLASMAAVVLQQNKYGYGATELQVVYNLVLVGTGIGLIVRGIRDDISHYFFLGVLTILGTGLFRYIDLVGDYIRAAILFAVLAAMLLIAARFWRSHHAGAGS